MVVRTSEGRFLEVLENAPATAVPIEVDIYSGADPATMLATLDGAFEKRFTRQLSEVGTGHFAIARNDPKATDVILAIGNLAKFKVLGTYRHAMWIENPSKIVVSTDEQGGEVRKLDGRGVLAYIDRAEVYPPVWPPAAADFVASSSADNGAGDVSLTVATPAGIVAGDVLVAIVTNLSGAPAIPAGWKRIRNVTNGMLRTTVYVRRALAGEASAHSWYWSSDHEATGVIVAVRNASSDDPTWAIADSTGAGSSIEEPSVSIPLVDGILLGVAAKAANVAISPPAGMVETEDAAAANRSLEVAYEINPAIGDSGDRVATGAGATDWIGISIWLPSTASADAVFTGATFGAILVTLVDAAQARGAIPDLTYDFTADVDSHGEPWPDTYDLSFHIGTSLLDVWRHLVTLGLEGGMTHALRLQAYVDAARHFEDSVILRKGRHFTGNVSQDAHGTGLRTRMLVEGAGGRIVEITRPADETDPNIGRREGYLGLSTSDNATTLQRAGEIALDLAADEDEARVLMVDHGLDPGSYEPWVHYQEGDWISTDEDGSGGDPTAQRAVALTLQETDGPDYTVELELNSVQLDAFLRLQRRLDALSAQSTSVGGSLGGGSSSASSGRVSSTSTDTPGYLFDKLTVLGLTKALVGDLGAQQVRLTGARASVEDGYAPLDSGLLVPAQYLGTGTPDTTTFLRGDGVWAEPAGGGGGGLLAVKRYGPTPGVTMSTSGWTIVDFDATNISLDVLVPASGSVLIQISGRFGLVSGYNSYVLLREGTATLEVRCVYSGGSPVGWLTLETLLTGQTPGMHTYKWSHYTNGGGTSYLRSNGDGGTPGEWPTIMKAFAA